MKQEVISNVRKLHSQAMDKADEAYVYRFRDSKSKEEIDTILTEAFNLEKKAAMLLKDELSAEPSRSVMFRSAASLALICGMKKEARELLDIGRQGQDVPSEILDEYLEIEEEFGLV